MPSVRQQIEERWPARLGDAVVPYDALRDHLGAELAARGVTGTFFNHFGLVVPDLDEGLAALATILGRPLPLTARAWVPAYEVHVARGPVEGVEIELIQPQGASFFHDALTRAGVGLQHVSFTVPDIEQALGRLAGAGVELVDAHARAGSHGKVAFARPASTRPTYLELCQPAPHAPVRPL